MSVVGLWRGNRPAPSTHAETLVWSHRNPADDTIETRKLILVLVETSTIAFKGEVATVYHAEPITKRVIRRFPR